MVALSELLDVPDLGLVPVVVPDAEVDVRWVATSELSDPTPFLEGGEVLLTTGLETRGWRAEWLGYVARLREAGIVAVGLGTGLTHRRPPASLVNACRTEGIALFEVPRATSFVAVSRAHVRLLDIAEQSMQRRILTAQRELTSVAASGGGDSDVLVALSRLLGGDVSLVDPDEPGSAEGEGRSGRVMDEIRRLAPLGMRASAAFSEPGATTSIQPVGLGGRPTGYLVVTVPGRPDELGRAAIATALSLLSLGAARRRREAGADRVLESAAWRLLIEGRTDLAELVLGAAGKGSGPSRVQVMAVVHDGEPGQDPDDVWERARTRRGFWIGSRQETRLCLAWADAAPRRFVSDLVSTGFRVGLGEPVSSSELGTAASTALHALDAASSDRPLVDWSDVARSGVVALLDDARAEAFAAALLDVLDEDQRATLVAFLTHHGSRVATSAALGVHRNTVRNRLAAVEQAWGRSLDDPSTRADAWVALQLRGRT